jgi:hypothetical protein
VTDVKSDGLPKQEKKIIALKIRLYMPFSLQQTPFVIDSWLCLISQKFLRFRSINTIDKMGDKKLMTLLFKYRAIYFFFY